MNDGTYGPSDKVVLFDRVGNRNSVHAAGCRMVRTGHKNGWARWIALEGDAYTINDLVERGFKLTYCKCLKGKK